MILSLNALRQIEAGSVTLAFRRWTRPTVRSGGTLMTHIGRLEVVSVTSVDEASITAEDARRAGYPTVEELVQELGLRAEGTVYRIEFGEISADPRIALRESLPDEQELAAVIQQLRKLDTRSPAGTWTRRALELIAENPGMLAERLARRMGMEKLDFKARVRKLKALGLTISLEVGYRLSTRGEFVLERLGAGFPPDAAVRADSQPSPAE